MIFLEPDAVNIYKAYFHLNKSIAWGISLDKRSWFKQEFTQEEKINITPLLGERILTDREKSFLEKTRFFVGDNNE